MWDEDRRPSKETSSSSSNLPHVVTSKCPRISSPQCRTSGFEVILSVGLISSGRTIRTLIDRRGSGSIFSTLSCDEYPDTGLHWKENKCPIERLKLLLQIKRSYKSTVEKRIPSNLRPAHDSIAEVSGQVVVLCQAPQASHTFESPS